MNTAFPIESPISRPSAGRRIRTTIAAWASSRRRELTREELAQRHEQRLMAERLLDSARISAYAARLF